ncbi:endopeptidase La [Poriferisphaera sp. WC338]|uniref:endopeptidase La n=1 Tax=Poriferisphaera sp. WC338 TaxID=3425129 RepID=UPI003D817E82
MPRKKASRKKTTRKKTSAKKTPTLKAGKRSRRKSAAKKAVGRKGKVRRKKVASAENIASPSLMIELEERDPEAVDLVGAIPAEIPIMPVRGMVMFPGTIMPIAVGRPSSLKLLDQTLGESKVIALFTQKDEDQETPTPDDVYEVGTAVSVLKLIRQPDDTVQIIVHGLSRVRIEKIQQHEPFLKAKVSQCEESEGPRGKSFKAAFKQLKDQARQLIEHTPGAPDQAVTVLMNIDDPSSLADFLVANLNLDVAQKQDLLEELDVAKRIRQVHRHVSMQLEIQQLQNKIQEDVQSSIGDSQRKFFLREQIKAIQRELGEVDDDAAFVDRLRNQLLNANPPDEVLSEALRELTRLELIPPASPEYSVISNYLELLGELPWKTQSEDNMDLARAQKILDRDHYGLDKVKRRLIEYLAVRKLNPKNRGPILCLVGPPGVGKTSLGQSIADALGRKFARMSFGGIRDESEIRGHRRTYIGAMPGRIIQELRRAGTNNPVMMLDEVDKLGADFRGDPASALLEVLDPRQNNAFVDRYLDVPFDLSQVIFIATANYMGNVPPALQDRMEVIEVPGYTDHDKLAIARKYLVPRQLKENGLTRKLCKWMACGLKKTIENYTREAGVRELERQVGAVCRGIAAEVASKSPGRRGGKQYVVDNAKVRKVLGPEKYVREDDIRIDVPGVTMGLAYTTVGGEVLFVEATSYPGKGEFKLTGQLGDVMRESVSAAMSVFKSRADTFGFNLTRLENRDVHIHVPAGAVPKDGPSAGVAMYSAIVSLLLDLPVKQGVAMTGEITLRGKVLPIGGVKEKTLAAARAGVTTVILPEDNHRDLEEIDPQVRKKIDFVFAADVDDVLDHVLGKKRIAGAVRKVKTESKSKKS